jgi:hypothetical protein
MDGNPLDSIHENRSQTVDQDSSRPGCTVVLSYFQQNNIEAVKAPLIAESVTE